jgi:hypothetical protein
MLPPLQGLLVLVVQPVVGPLPFQKQVAAL